MKVAYVVNQYPKVSHTFIRREIAALEGLGAEVARFSVRACPDDLVDPDDIAEVSRTRVILSVGVAGLMLALLRVLLTSPVRFIRALSLATRIGYRSERGLARHLAYLAEACVLRAWLVERGSTFVHAHFGTNSAAVAMLCHVLGGPPYSFTVHGPEEFDKASLISLGEKMIHARFVVAITNYCRSQLFRQCAYLHWSKVHIVHCALGADFLQAEPTPIPEVPRFVSVGRLSEQKGQLLLVQAAAQLAQRGVDFELVLVGDGEMRGEIEAQIARFGLGDRIRITGWAANARVREELAGGRVMVLPSFAEGLPVVIMEALALGRPVLTTYVAGIPELVAPDCGWLIPAGSVDAIADGMQAALALDTATLEQLGRAGRAKVQAGHDATREAGVLLGLFERYGSVPS